MKLSSRLLSFILFMLFAIPCIAQDIYNIWEGEEVPFYKENDLKEYEESPWGSICVYNVTRPTLTVYEAKGENTGKAVVICPGGGYTLEAIYHEGYDLAEFLSNQGITAAVLKYRLPNPESSDKPEMVALSDARRALVLLGKHAEKYGIDKKSVGIMGFSAGSHLATVTSLWVSDNEAENPDFSVLIYGVTDLKPGTRNWLEESLYHRPMSEEELAQYRLLDLVSPDTPPAFLVHAYDDDVCHVSESTMYAEKLFEQNVEAEMHLFPKGGHGFGMGNAEDGTDQWVPLFVSWIKRSTF